MIILQSLLALIISFEGFSPTAYWDNGWAIGYGHHGPEVTKDLVYTKEKAYEVLKDDINRSELCVQRNSPNCRGNCTISMVDFVYNVGCGAYNQSHLRKLINKEDWPAAQKELMKWVHSRGKVIPGLVKRRATEASLLGE